MAAPGNFSVVTSGTLDGSATPGSAVFTTTDLLMTGSDSAEASCTNTPCVLAVSLARPGTYSFDWLYTSHDGAGAAFDWFGLALDGLSVGFDGTPGLPSVSDPGGAPVQSGHFSQVVKSSFAWFIDCQDCVGGNAVVQITNFVTTAAPEPTGWALMLASLSLAAMSGAQRRRSA